MEKRNTYLDTLNDIKNITKTMKAYKPLNEALSFDDDYGYDEMGSEEAMPQEEPEMEMQGEMEESALEQIREIALQGMVALSKNTEDPQYEVLKKIFLMLDKANDKKAQEEEK